jgi:hypothetical protein
LILQNRGFPRFSDALPLTGWKVPEGISISNEILIALEIATVKSKPCKKRLFLLETIEDWRIQITRGNKGILAVRGKK